MSRRVRAIAASLVRRPAAAVNAMRHVVLLGDSVFDNAAYVGSDPDVVRQLREALPADWRASLVARDGAVIADLPAQPEEAAS